MFSCSVNRIAKAQAGKSTLKYQYHSIYTPYTYKIYGNLSKPLKKAEAGPSLFSRIRSPGLKQSKVIVKLVLTKADFLPHI